MNDDTDTTKKQTAEEVLHDTGVKIINNDSTVTELEQEFQKELTPHATAKAQSVGDSSLSKKLGSLEETEQKIETEIHNLEADVKGKLTNLKKIRGDIESELEQIKELQATVGKIKEEEQKITTLETDRQRIEEEIVALEEGVLKNLD